MTVNKVSGLADQFYVAGYDLSGAVNALDKIACPVATWDATTISQSAAARGFGQRDGGIDFTTLMLIDSAGPTDVTGNLKALPTADVIGTYAMAAGAMAAGNPGACILAKQVGYDPTRDNKGFLTLKVSLQANGYGLEWGKQLTAGLRTDTAATAGPVYDDAAATSYGGQAYFQLTAFTGTSVTIDIQHATTSGGSYVTTGLTSQAFTAAPGWQRVAVANTTTIDEFLKVVTTGTFTSAKFSVVFVRNPVAGVIF